MITGAIVGVIGSVVNRGVAIFETRQQAKIDEKRRSDELELAKINAAKETMVATFTHDAAIGEGGSQWVANIRSLVRPAITGYGLLLITLLYFFADAAGKASIIASAVEMGTMSVTWWFGSRDLKR